MSDRSTQPPAQRPPQPPQPPRAGQPPGQSPRPMPGHTPPRPGQSASPQPGQQPPSGQPPAPAQQSQFPPPQPGEQRAGYPAGPPEPGQPGYRPPSEQRAAPQRDEKAEAEHKEALAVSSIGAQIILDYNSEAGLGARGGAGATVEENQLVRDQALVAVGLDPQSPSGPPPMAPLEPPPEVVRSTPPVSSKATRMSSLAAGIITGNEATPPPPEGGGGATAPANTTVPAVTQTGTTLTCTQGEWSGEPTSYSYAWKLDDAAAGSDAATYDVQAGDVGKAATCTVTATNAAGSAAAPPSNGVVITGP